MGYVRLWVKWVQNLDGLQVNYMGHKTFHLSQNFLPGLIFLFLSIFFVVRLNLMGFYHKKLIWHYGNYNESEQLTMNVWMNAHKSTLHVHENLWFPFSHKWSMKMFNPGGRYWGFGTLKWWSSSWSEIDLARVTK